MQSEMVFQAKAALDALAAADHDHFAGCDRAGLDQMLAALGRVRGVVAGFEVAIARRSRCLAAEGPSECAEAVLAEHGAGTVSTGHLDALAAATHGLDDDTKAAFVEHGPQLADRAASMTVGEFAHQCRDLARFLSTDTGEARLEQQRQQRSLKRWTDRITGMCHLHATLDPLAGARRVDRRVPDVAVHIDWRTLLEGLHARSICETSDGTHLPVSTVRRLCCDAEIFPVVLGADGAVLDAGRSQRLANREQRRTLRAMYRTCGHPDCTHRSIGARSTTSSHGNASSPLPRPTAARWR